jgi:hypothetical protein
MMLPPDPSKRAVTTDRMFWELVKLTKRVDRHEVDANELREPSYALAKYLVTHGGYFRLQETILYLATSVAINTIVGDSDD